MHILSVLIVFYLESIPRRFWLSVRTGQNKFVDNSRQPYIAIAWIPGSYASPACPLINSRYKRAFLLFLKFSAVLLLAWGIRQNTATRHNTACPWILIILYENIASHCDELRAFSFALDLRSLGIIISFDRPKKIGLLLMHKIYKIQNTLICGLPVSPLVYCFFAQIDRTFLVIKYRSRTRSLLIRIGIHSDFEQWIYCRLNLQLLKNWWIVNFVKRRSARTIFYDLPSLPP